MSFLFVSINFLLYAVPVCALILAAFPHKLRVPAWAAVLAAIGVGFVLDLFTQRSYMAESALYPWRTLIRTSWILMLYLTVRIFIRARSSHIIFAILVFTNYLDTISLISKTVAFFLFGLSSRDSLSWYYVLTKLMVQCIIFPLMALFAVRLLRPAMEAGGNMPFWNYLWIIPLSHFALYRTGISPEFNSRVVWRGDTFLLPCAWAAGIFLSYFVLLKMMTGVVKKIQLEERLHVYETQISMQKDRYVILQENIEETHRARHDLRHHLHAVEGYIETRDCSGMEQYLRSCIDALDQAAVLKE